MHAISLKSISRIRGWRPLRGWQLFDKDRPVISPIIKKIWISSPHIGYAFWTFASLRSSVALPGSDFIGTELRISPSPVTERADWRSWRSSLTGTCVWRGADGRRAPAGPCGGNTGGGVDVAHDDVRRGGPKKWAGGDFRAAPAATSSPCRWCRRWCASGPRDPFRRWWS